MVLPPPLGNLGQRLLPSVIDDIARDNPSRILYSVAKTRNISDGFQDIDAQTFAQAVNRCAWHLEKTIGRGEGFPTLLYMGPQDLAYGIVVMACVKTGYKLLLSSPRNTLEAHVHLLEKTECSTMLLPPVFHLPIIKQIRAARDMKVVEIAEVQHWLTSSEPTAPYPYTKTFAEAKLDPWVVLHTSGSTGMPKPIIQAHATYSNIDAFTGLPSLGLQPVYPVSAKGRRVYLGFPLFHCAGIMMLVPASIFGEFTVVLGPFPPSAETVNEVILHGNVQELTMAPTTVIDLTNYPAYLENLQIVQQVTTGGGAVPKATGDLVSSRTIMANVLGSSEVGLLPHLLPADPEDWMYMSFSPVLGHEFRPVSKELYEHVIVRSTDPGLLLYQGVFGTFPDLKEWNMKDLYSKHPTKEDLWLYRGRNDDVIVFSTGEKLQSMDMESIIRAHPAVNGALICGAGRFQSSLLIEARKPLANEAERERLLNDIWPTVQEANKESPSHGRIQRDMVIFTPPDKPMARAGKGTIQRQATVNLFEKELDALYSRSPDYVQPNGDNVKYSDTTDAIQHIVGAASDIDIGGVSSSSDLFDFGLDSLQVTNISKEINKYLVSVGKPPGMESKYVYSHPSISGLAQTLAALAEGKVPEPRSTEKDTEKMQKLYELHTDGLVAPEEVSRPDHNDFVVLLTGSTGSLGSYILDALISETRVTHIYCLNRGSGSLERQQKSHAAKGLQRLTDKVTCFDADMSREFFGLPSDTHSLLSRQVTHIIHNAWQVDFNLSLDFFAGQVSIVRRLVDFSVSSSAGALLFFISSISAVAGHTGEPVPERILEDWSAPTGNGYGQSKLVSERIIDAASKQARVPGIVCRVGQVAGPTTPQGIWPKQEWFPSLIASSLHLGKLPDSLGQMSTIDWIPVDILGRSLVELAIGGLEALKTRPPGAGATVYHAVNPKRTPWEELLGVVSGSLSAGAGTVQTVPLESWLEVLRSSAEEADLTLNPAVKILDFYESLVTGKELSFDTKGTVQHSPTLAGLDPVQVEWMETWLRQWSF